MATINLLKRLIFSRILLGFFVLSLAWSFCLLIAPLSLPPGTVKGLSGYANRIDNAKLWDTLPPFQRMIYYAGDIECHQISNRSFYLNGNQLPVCSRDISIFFFFSFGLLTSMFLQPFSDISRGLMALFPRSFRVFIKKRVRYEYFLPLFVVLCLIPLAVDGSLQLLTDYESTNPIRFCTGIPSGWILGTLIGVMIRSIKRFNLERGA